MWLVKDPAQRPLGMPRFQPSTSRCFFVDAKIDRVKEVLDKSRQRVKGISKAAERLARRKSGRKETSAPLLQALDEVVQQLKVAESWMDAGRVAAQGIARLSEAVVSSQYAASHEESTGIEITRRLQECLKRLPKRRYTPSLAAGNY